MSRRMPIWWMGLALAAVVLLPVRGSAVETCILPVMPSASHARPAGEIRRLEAECPRECGCSYSASRLKLVARTDDQMLAIAVWHACFRSMSESDAQSRVRVVLSHVHPREIGRLYRGTRGFRRHVEDTVCDCPADFYVCRSNVRLRQAIKGLRR